MYVFFQDSIVPEVEARVSVYDHGFLYGDGVYETMRAYGGVVFMRERHIERLERSASLIRLALPPADFIRHAITEALSANRLADAYIRVTVSRGKGPVGLDPGLCRESTFVVMAHAFREYPAEYYEKGVRLIIARTRRNSVHAIDPKIKSLNFLNNILAKIEAGEAGAYEALMLSPEGYIAEGTISNIFFVSSGALCTPSADTGILDGITREIVLGIAREQGIPVREEKLLPEDLFAASEVFFTNTTSEVMPVSQVGDRSYAVGEMTRRLRLLYREKVGRYLAENPS